MNLIKSERELVAAVLSDVDDPDAQQLRARILAHRDAEDRDIGNDNEIEMYMHCGLCLEEIKAMWDQGIEISPQEYARVQAGWTRQGIQVWCNRHEVNVMHMDFQGNKHPANTSRKPFEGEEQ